MADYLLPNDSGLSIADQRYIFGMRNRKISLPSNLSSSQNVTLCISCSNIENMQHIYACSFWNIEEEEISYEMIFTDQIRKQKKVYERFKNSYENREKYKTESENKCEKDKVEENGNHVILNGDPLSSELEYSNGM